MVKVIGVVHVEPDLRSEELRSVWSVFGARVAGKPAEVCKCEWFGPWVAGGLLLHCPGGRFCGRSGFRKVIVRDGRLYRCRGDLAVSGVGNGLRFEL